MDSVGVGDGVAVCDAVADGDGVGDGVAEVMGVPAGVATEGIDVPGAVPVGVAVGVLVGVGVPDGWALMTKTGKVVPPRVLLMAYSFSDTLCKPSDALDG